MDAVDPGRCPLCGRANACALACGASGSGGRGAATACWCVGVTFDRAALQRVPEAARGRAGVCAACAAHAAGATGSPRATDADAVDATGCAPPPPRA